MTEPDGAESGLILSAYNAAPAIDSWKPAGEAAYLEAVSTLPGVAGLEIPLYGEALHRYDSAGFLRSVPRLPQHLRFIITTIPDTMDRLGRDPAFGLASDDPGGRASALRAASRASDAVRRLNDAAGHRAVTAVHLFSAPRAGRAGGRLAGAALCASLNELASFPWDDAQPVVEHCDAAGPDGMGIKGFLAFEAEIEATLAADAGTGIAVNWARSVIEQRDVTAPARHAKLALDAGVLAGAVLSGCSTTATEYGAAWDDAHLPPQPVESESLLTTERIRDFADILRNSVRPVSGIPPYRGLKISAPPHSNWRTRVAIVERSLTAARDAGWL